MALSTKYPKVTTLPKAAQRVKAFADSQGWAVGYVYVKYERSLDPEKKTTVNYKIVQFQGINFVVPA